MVIMMKRSRYAVFLPALLLAFLLCLALLLASCSKPEESGLPEGCLRAENEATDYTFCYPEEWEIDRNDGMISVKYNVGERGAIAYASVSVQAFSLEKKDTGANGYWDEYRKQLEDVYGEKLTFSAEKEQTSLGGVIANRNRYTLRLTDVTYAFEQVICIRNGTVYLVTLTVPEQRKDAVTEAYETILSTFAFE